MNKVEKPRLLRLKTCSLRRKRKLIHGFPKFEHFGATPISISSKINWILTRHRKKRRKNEHACRMNEIKNRIQFRDSHSIFFLIKSNLHLIVSL